MTKHIIFWAWVIWVILNTGGLNATFRERWKSTDRHIAREQLLMAAFFSVIPPTLIFSTLTTGIYEDGFSWSWRPYVKETEIK